MPKLFWRLVHGLRWWIEETSAPERSRVAVIAAIWTLPVIRK